MTLRKDRLRVKLVLNSVIVRIQQFHSIYDAMVGHERLTTMASSVVPLITIAVPAVGSYSR